MTPETICLSLELAKELKEAGFDKETCFIWYNCKCVGEEQSWKLVSSYYKQDGFVTQDRLDRIYPAPTSAEIVLPMEITCVVMNEDLDGRRGYECRENFLDYEKRKYTQDSVIGCFGPKYSPCYSMGVGNSWADSEVESKAKAWIYLKKKGLIC